MLCSYHSAHCTAYICYRQPVDDISGEKYWRFAGGRGLSNGREAGPLHVVSFRGSGSAKQAECISGTIRQGGNQWPAESAEEQSARIHMGGFSRSCRKCTFINGQYSASSKYKPETRVSGRD
ncbi:hypothetical protein D3C75_1163700 [compost metagenome]